MPEIQRDQTPEQGAPGAPPAAERPLERDLPPAEGEAANVTGGVIAPCDRAKQ